jgi:glutamate--cysteine ligase catalytic subunit
MGLLTKGTPLPWSQAKEYAEHVRQHGVQQFLHVYAKVKDRQRDCLVWGDEIEYQMVQWDEEKKHVRLSLRASDVLIQLQAEEQAMEEQGCV